VTFKIIGRRKEVPKRKSSPGGDKRSEEKTQQATVGPEEGGTKTAGLQIRCLGLLVGGEKNGGINV